MSGLPKPCPGDPAMKVRLPFKSRSAAVSPLCATTVVPSSSTRRMGRLATERSVHFQLVPLRSPVDDDDWKWKLRSVANRPILRVLEDGTNVVAQSGESAADRDLKGTLTFLAGSPGQGFGSPDMSAGFAVEHSLLSSGTLRLNGNVGYGAGAQRIPAAVLRTTSTNRFTGAFQPSVRITTIRRNSPNLIA